MRATLVCGDMSTEIYLVDGRLDKLVIQEFFEIRNIHVNGALMSWNQDNLSYQVFEDGDVVQISGDPLPGELAQHEATAAGCWLHEDVVHMALPEHPMPCTLFGVAFLTTGSSHQH